MQDWKGQADIRHTEDRVKVADLSTTNAIRTFHIEVKHVTRRITLKQLNRYKLSSKAIPVTVLKLVNQATNVRLRRVNIITTSEKTYFKKKKCTWISDRNNALTEHTRHETLAAEELPNLAADFVLQRYPNCFMSSSGDVHLLYCGLCFMSSSGDVHLLYCGLCFMSSSGDVHLLYCGLCFMSSSGDVHLLYCGLCFMSSSGDVHLLYCGLCFMSSSGDVHLLNCGLCFMSSSGDVHLLYCGLCFMSSSGDVHLLYCGLCFMSSSGDVHLLYCGLCFMSSSGDVHLLYCGLCRLFPFPRICRIIFVVLFRRRCPQNFVFYALHCNRHERRMFYFYRRFCWISVYKTILLLDQCIQNYSSVGSVYTKLFFCWISVYKTILFRKESIILCSNVSLAAERSVNTRINPSSTAALCPLRSDRTRL